MPDFLFCFSFKKCVKYYWQNHFKGGFKSFWNIHLYVVKCFKSISKMFSVSVVCTDSDNWWVVKKCFFKWEYSAFCVMDIYSVNMNSEEISHSICNYVPFSSFRFFPPSNPRFSLLYTVFTFCESIRAYVGLSLFPFTFIAWLPHQRFYHFPLFICQICIICFPFIFYYHNTIISHFLSITTYW